MRRMLRMCTVVVGVLSGPLGVGAAVSFAPAPAGATGAPLVAAWDGGGDGTRFSDPANWVGDIVPADDSAVDLTSASCSAVLHNDLPGGLLVSALTAPPRRCTVDGNPVRISGPVDADDLVLLAPLVLGGDATIASGTVRPASIDLAGHRLRIEATVDPNLGPSSSVVDSVGGGQIVVTPTGRLWATGAGTVGVTVEGSLAAPTSDALWLRGSWGAVDATGTIVNAAAATFSTMTLRSARLWPWGPVTVDGDLVLSHHSRLNAGSDFAPDYSLHVRGDLVLDRATFSTAAIAAVTRHLVVATVDGTVTGSFDGLAEGAILRSGTTNAFRFSYRGGDGNDPTLDWVQPDVDPTGTTLPGDTDLQGDVDGEVGVSASERLPETGTSVGSDVAFAVVLVLVGGVMLLRTRRRPV